MSRLDIRPKSRARGGAPRVPRLRLLVGSLATLAVVTPVPATGLTDHPEWPMTGANFGAVTPADVTGDGAADAIVSVSPPGEVRAYYGAQGEGPDPVADWSVVGGGTFGAQVARA